ncbi:MAG TPA: zinc ribbon domain-containing protein [Blastocatellia bacterium]|nr:zinc ribbon domain-containing protein [Blastocatellia bacterium]
MKSNTGELSVRNESRAQGSGQVDEIDLYGDLADYSQLSPEEQEACSTEMPEELKAEASVPLEPAFERAEEVSSQGIEYREPVPSPAARGDLFFEPARDSNSPIKIEPIEPLPDKTEPAPARMGTGELLSAFASFTDAPLTSRPAETRAGLCSACACELDSEDLFCVSCGAFHEEPPALEMPVETALAIPLTGLACADCGEVINPGEIFCPCCGAVAP